MDDAKNYVSCEECVEHRKELELKNAKQDEEMHVIKAELGIFKKLAYAILTTLIGGFAGTIFAVLSIG